MKDDPTHPVSLPHLQYSGLLPSQNLSLIMTPLWVTLISLSYNKWCWVWHAIEHVGVA